MVDASTIPLKVGAVVSSVTAVWSVVVVSGEPRLPALSSTVMLKAALPFAVSGTVPVAFHSLPSSSSGVIVTSVRLPSVTSLAVGVWTGSLVVKLSVTVSSRLPSAVSALSETSETLLTSGTVVSMPTELPSSVCVTVAPALPALSSNTTFRDTGLGISIKPTGVESEASTRPSPSLSTAVCTPHFLVR